MAILRYGLYIFAGFGLCLSFLLSSAFRQPQTEWIIFTNHTTNQYYLPGERAIYRMQSDGSYRQQFLDLPATNSPEVTEYDEKIFSWSSDGKWLVIVYRTQNFQYRIYRVLANGKRLEQLIDANGMVTGVDFSPDDQKLILALDVGASPQLFIFNLNTHTLEQLTQEVQSTGRWMGSVRWVDNNWFYTNGFAFMDLLKQVQFSQQPQVLESGSPTGHVVDFDISPDGEWLVYVVYEETASGRNANLYRMRSDGSERLQLTALAVNEIYPSWSPDGQWIVFASNQDGDYDLYKMRSDGTDIQQITNMAGDELSPSWSPPIGTTWRNWRLLAVSLMCGFVAMSGELRRFVANKVLGNKSIGRQIYRRKEAQV